MMDQNAAFLVNSVSYDRSDLSMWLVWFVTWLYICSPIGFVCLMYFNYKLFMK
jgi:hypothetical protein